VHLEFSVNGRRVAEHTDTTNPYLTGGVGLAMGTSHPTRPVMPSSTTSSSPRPEGPEQTDTRPLQSWILPLYPPRHKRSYFWGQVQTYSDAPCRSPTEPLWDLILIRDRQPSAMPSSLCAGRAKP
jgi:hypothetical protein